MNDGQTEAILAEITAAIDSGQLEIPGLPDIAMRVKKAIDEQDLDTASIAKIIQSDIPLAGRLIQIANSPLYRGVKPAQNCNAAVLRLGLNVTKNLVTSFTLRRLFTRKNSNIRKHTEYIWNHSVKVAAIGFVLARITLGYDPDSVMLAGILHDTGSLIFLAYAEKHPELLENDDNFKQLNAQLRGPLGSIILTNWEFDDTFVTVAKEVEQWSRDSGSKPDLCDIVLIAKLHALLSEKKKPAISLNNIPAFNKFPVFSLGPSSSIELLEEAADEIAEIKHMLFD